MSITFNPYLTTNAAGSFAVSSSGYMQGTALDQPAIRNSLFAGWYTAANTTPLWGGIPISDAIPNEYSGTTYVNKSLGTLVTRATTLTLTAGTSGGITGFSVFDQNHSALQWPGNEVPIVQGGGSCNFYRLGCGARIVVAMDPSLISNAGSIVTTAFSWDFNNNCLAPKAGSATYSLSSVTWASTNGGQLTIVASGATPVAAIGDLINISGATNSGTGGSAAINTNFVITAFTDNQHFVAAAPAASGVFGSIAGSPVLNYDTTALVVDVLDFNVGNSMTVNWNGTNATWNRSGSVAVIQI